MRPAVLRTVLRSHILYWLIAGIVITLVAFLATTGQPLTTPLIEKSFNSIAYDYHSPYLAPLAAGPAGPRLVPGRVVIVVVDGLRLDTSQTAMPGLKDLRQRGADLKAVTGEPSLSLPGWTVISSGAWQEVSAVTTNFYTGTVKVDTLFKQAQSKGLKTAVVGSKDWGQLFKGQLDVSEGVDEPPSGSRDVTAFQAADAQVLLKALLLLREQGSPAPDLLVVHFPAVDSVSHAYGGASRETQDTATKVDTLIAQLAQALDLSRDALVVTADHGHIDRGGHGGWEPVVKTVPLVFVGKAIRPGQYPQARQADIAPTVAGLLGLPMPVESQGRPLLELLDAPPADLGKIGQAAAIQLATFYDNNYYQGVSQGRDLGGPFAQAIRARYQPQIEAGDATALADFVRDMNARAANVREQRLADERQSRLPLAILVAILPLAYFIFRRPSRLWLVALVGTLAYFALFLLLYFGVYRYDWSLSVFNQESDIVAFLKARTIEAAVLMLLAGLIAGVLARRRTVREVAGLGVDTLFLIGYVLLLQILYFYWQWGATFTWTLPDLRLGFKYYLDLIQLGAIYLPVQPPMGVPLVLVMPLAAIAGLGLARLIANIRERRMVPPPPAAPPAGQAPAAEQAPSGDEATS